MTYFKYCPYCGSTDIYEYDPILDSLSQRGECRSCEDHWYA